MNSYFFVYLIGYGLMIVAVWFGLDAAGVSQTWKLVAGAFLLGLGIIYAFSQAQTDTARREQARNQQGGGNPQGGAQGGGGNAQGNAGTQQGSTQQQNPPPA